MHRSVLYVSFNETFFFFFFTKPVQYRVSFFFFYIKNAEFSNLRFFFLSQVLGFKDTYIWLKDDDSGQQKRGGFRSTKALNSSSKVTKVRR